MKKLSAILLISLLVFNWYGYRLFTNYLQKKADRQLESRIDVNDYEESQLIEIRVALNMPYQNDQPSFERQYGEIEIKGKVYTYVKQKIENGYLVLKCIANTAKQDIRTADNILFNINNGIDQEHNNSGNNSNSPLNTIAKSIFGGDFDDQCFSYGVIWTNGTGKNWPSSGNFFIPAPVLAVGEQPPEDIIS